MEWLNSREDSYNIRCYIPTISEVKKCENRVLAEQLIAICNKYNWDPRTMLKADPIKTLDAWSKKRKPKTKANISNSVENIHKKLDHIEEVAYRWYFKNKKKGTNEWSISFY